MKLAIIGSRGFNDYARLKFQLDQLQEKHKISLIISGGARGADTLAEQYADENKIQKLILPADWDKHGRGAGFIRNKDIVDKCDKLFAFWDGESKGTRHSMDLAIQQKKQIFVEMYNENETTIISNASAPGNHCSEENQTSATKKAD